MLWHGRSGRSIAHQTSLQNSTSVGAVFVVISEGQSSFGEAGSSSACADVVWLACSSGSAHIAVCLTSAGLSPYQVTEQRPPCLTTKAMWTTTFHWTITVGRTGSGTPGWTRTHWSTCETDSSTPCSLRWQSHTPGSSHRPSDEYSSSSSC